MDWRRCLFLFRSRLFIETRVFTGEFCAHPDEIFSFSSFILRRLSAEPERSFKPLHPFGEHSFTLLFLAATPSEKLVGGSIPSESEPVAAWPGAGVCRPVGVEPKWETEKVNKPGDDGACAGPGLVGRGFRFPAHTF